MGGREVVDGAWWSMVAWMELRRSSPIMYSRWEGMYGKVVSRRPSI